MTRRSQFVSLRIALFYCFAAGAWIILSDLLVAWRSQESVGVAAVNIGKGLLFVTVTGAALFLVLRRVLQTEMEARAAAEATARQLTELRQLTEHSEEIFYQHD